MVRPDRVLGPPREDQETPGDLHIARRHVIIVDPLGLHMRPAAKLVALARSFRSDIRVIFNDTTVDGKSMLDLATLAAECGAMLEVVADGPDADEAIAALADLIVAGTDDAQDGSVAGQAI